MTKMTSTTGATKGETVKFINEASPDGKALMSRNGGEYTVLAPGHAALLI
jgi:hypothetical protein